ARDWSSDVCSSDLLGARYQAGLGEERETRPETTRRPAAGERRQLRPTMARHQLGEPFEAAGQQFDPLGTRPLLRRKHGSGTVTPDQRRRHVAERENLRPEAPATTQVRQLRQRAPALRKRLSVRIEKRPPESASRAGPAVHRRRAT